jgi:uncharacterized protein
MNSDGKRTLSCPRDASLIARQVINGAEVDVCAQCGGMFLERGELNRVAEPTEGDIEFSTVDLDTFQHEDGYGPINCPNDGSAMSKVEFNIYTNIILDYCQSCHGFWVDARELARINEEVRELNDADREVGDPWTVRLGQFFWSLPFPK